MADQQLGFFVNLQRCLGCHTCEVACKDWHGLAPGPRWRRVRTVEGGTYPRPFAYFVSIACNHCAEPICVSVCPAKAYTKRPDGLVVHDPSRCMGCQYCTFACPYGAPQYDEAAGRAGKCSGCYGRVDAGEEPVCVGSCIGRALEFGPLSELEKRHPGCVSTIGVMPPAEMTRPSLRLLRRPESQSAPSRIVDGHRTRPVEGGKRR